MKIFFFLIAKITLLITSYQKYFWKNVNNSWCRQMYTGVQFSIAFLCSILEFSIENIFFKSWEKIVLKMWSCSDWSDQEVPPSLQRQSREGAYIDSWSCSGVSLPIRRQSLLLLTIPKLDGVAPLIADPPLLKLFDSQELRKIAVTLEQIVLFGCPSRSIIFRNFSK